MENWLLLQTMLEVVGFVVAVAEDGQQGIERWESWQPDFIWMDVRMPVLDGLEATRRIRALPAGDKVRIAALTASAFNEDRDQVMAAGMDDFVRKPYRADEIFDCLARHLGVQYRFADSSAPATTQPATSFTGADLASISAELRARLRAAFLAFDAPGIRSVIDSVGEQHPALAGALR